MNRFSFLAVALLTFGGTMQAQKNQKLVEPEFNNTYCLLTSDTTYAILPRKMERLKSIKTRFQSGLRLSVVSRKQLGLPVHLSVFMVAPLVRL